MKKLSRKWYFRIHDDDGIGGNDKSVVIYDSYENAHDSIYDETAERIERGGGDVDVRDLHAYDEYDEELYRFMNEQIGSEDMEGVWAFDPQKKDIKDVIAKLTEAGMELVSLETIKAKTAKEKPLQKLSKQWYFKIVEIPIGEPESENYMNVFICDSRENAEKNMPHYDFDEELYGFMDKYVGPEAMEGIWTFNYKKTNPETIRKLLTNGGMVEVANAENARNINQVDDETLEIEDEENSEYGSFDINALKRFIRRAIEEEDYEEAAKIRDEINKRNKK